MQYNYPHTIDNGQGEQLTFVRRVKDGNREYLEVENLDRPVAGRQCTCTTGRRNR